MQIKKTYPITLLIGQGLDRLSAVPPIFMPYGIHSVMYCHTCIAVTCDPRLPYSASAFGFALTSPFTKVPGTAITPSAALFDLSLKLLFLLIGSKYEHMIPLSSRFVKSIYMTPWGRGLGVTDGTLGTGVRCHGWYLGDGGWGSFVVHLQVKK